MPVLVIVFIQCHAAEYIELIVWCRVGVNILIPNMFPVGRHEKLFLYVFEEHSWKLWARRFFHVQRKDGAWDSGDR